MSLALYESAWVPPEWMAAHGWRPSRRLPEPADATAPVACSTGVCPFAHRFLEYVRRDPAEEPRVAIFSTECDQMRRSADVLAREGRGAVFLLNVPATWQTTVGRQLYRQEIERLGRFLVRLGGQAPSADQLRRIVAEFEARRSALRRRRASLAPRAYAEALGHFQRAPGIGLGEAAPPAATATESAGAWEAGNRVPLALLGGPLQPAHFGLFDAVEAHGGWVALNATTHGELGLLPPLKTGGRAAEPLGVLLEAYLEGVPSVFRRPNTLLYDWLRAAIAERKVRGLVLAHYLWCDLWHAEAGRLKQELGLPLLRLELSGDPRLHAHLAGRLQAFVETLREAP